MSIAFCKECDQVVEGNTIKFICPECNKLYIICQFCEEDNVIELSDDDDRGNEP